MKEREAVADDAEAIAKVMIDGMRSVFVGLVPDHLLEWPESVVGWRKTLTDDLVNGTFLDVAETENGLVVGYVMGGKSSSCFVSGRSAATECAAGVSAAGNWCFAGAPCCKTVC
jgi:hypothetical protein